MTRKSSPTRTKAIIGSTSSESSPAAAEEIAGNVDLLSEILLRLPVNSLVRFKCVSRHWLSLISNSHFALNHFRQSPWPSSISGLYFNRMLSVALHGHQNLPYLAFLDGLGGKSTRIEDSCNGLLLCDNGYVVCNPTTQKYTILPKPSCSSSGNHCAYLAFDPSKSPHYKVLLVTYSGSPPFQCDIFCSESACWKQVFVRERFYTRGVFWNGAIHWLSDDYFLSRFDFGAEKLITISTPPAPVIQSLDKVMHFGESGGHLLLMKAMKASGHILGFTIFEMAEDYYGWVVKCHVPLQSLMEKARCNAITVLYVVKGEKENDFALVLSVPGRIVSYNPISKTLTVLRELGGVAEISGIGFPFVESLSPV